MQPEATPEAEVGRRCARPTPLWRASPIKSRKTLKVRGAADLVGRLQAYRAGSGDVLELEGGLYTINLHLTHTELVLRAAPGAEVTLTSDKGCTIEIDTEYLQLEGLTILGKGEMPAVVVQRGSAEISSCTISGVGGGVLVNRGDPTISRCRIHGCRRGPGIHFLNSAGRVEECEIYGNLDAGIVIERAAANPWISGCNVSDGKACGIACTDGAQGCIRECSIVNNACTGILVQSAAHPTVVGCTIQGNQAPGITVEGRARGLFEGCRFTGNAIHDALVTTHANPKICHCDFRDGKASGIMVTDHGLGVIEANMLCNFGLAAISICSMADPIVSDNTIQIGEGGDKDTRYAILVRDQGRGQVQNNRLEGWAAPESDPAPVPKAVPEAAAAKLKPATGSTSGKSPLRNRPGTSAQGQRK
eukprot:GGOE01003598.1.p1 GENE.GGOE01003598.1~~GGOE01003598.1.p1  ORF type:complete len:445 (-),score=95.00 GGOE01003598.1:409-1662(-)